jgi:hypothetical protein
MFPFGIDSIIQTMLKTVTSLFDDFPNATECESKFKDFSFTLNQHKIYINILACSCRVLKKTSCNTNMDAENLQYICSTFS